MAGPHPADTVMMMAATARLYRWHFTNHSLLLVRLTNASLVPWRLYTYEAGVGQILD